MRLIKWALVVSLVSLLGLACLNCVSALDEIGRTWWSDANSAVIWEHYTTNIRLFTPAVVCLVVAFLCFWELCKLKWGG